MNKYLKLFTLLLFNAFAAQTVGLQQHDSGSLDDGYILFAPNNSTTTYLIDKCGKQVKSWPSNNKTGHMTYLLPDGQILRAGNSNNTTFNVGGSGGIIQKIDWNGNVTWSYTISDATKCQHHDVKALPNGNILIIAWELKSNSEAVSSGRDPALLAATLWSEQIIEVQPTGSSGGIMVWEWHLWDHLVQDFDTTKNNFGLISSSPELININYNASNFITDWIHFNAIDYNAELDQILVSSHKFDEVWIIDHSTTTAQAASHSGGNSGKGGDLLYRWGNPAAYNNGTVKDQKLFGQHNARWIEKDLPFQDQIMIFNNGNGRPGGNYSTVEIINPPANGNSYTATLPYLPITTSWNYNYGNPNNLYSQNISGAQQLSNGNVLITSGVNGIFKEVTSSGSSVWKYTNPVNLNGIIDQGVAPSQNQVFRSTFYPKNYAGFAGQTLVAGNTIETSNFQTSSCALILNSEEIPAAKSSSVYPNPAGDHIYVKLNHFTSNKIAIYNAAGQEVLNLKNVTEQNKISTLHFPDGIYFLKIVNDKEFQTFKIIVNH